MQTMFQNTFLVTLFFVLLAVAVIHLLGLAFFLYWRIWWLDIFNHFGGGFWVGGMVLWGYQRLFPSFSQNTSRVAFITLAILGAFVVGIWWEIYEVLIGSILLPSEEYFSDTIIDLIADTVGAIAAALLFLHLRCREDEETTKQHA